MNRSYVVSPEAIIRRCIVNGLLTLDEATTLDGKWDPEIERAATQVADDLRDSWPEGEGFGSSDFTFLAQDFLREAGLKAEFVDNRLTRI